MSFDAGVQLVIVWDGDIQPAEPQEIGRPKMPLKVKVGVDETKQQVDGGDEELGFVEKPAVVEVKLD